MWDNISISPPPKKNWGDGVWVFGRGIGKNPTGIITSYHYYILEVYIVYTPQNLIPTHMLLYIIGGKTFYAASLQDALTQSATAITVAQN